MKKLLLIIAVAVVAVSGTSTALAQSSGQDPRALKVLKSMSDHLDGLNSFRIKGHASTDARLDAGLIVSNTQDIQVAVKRPGSMHFHSFNGEETRHLYVHDGQLSVYTDASNSYAQAEVDKNLDAALDQALEDYGVDLPLMDIVQKDTFGKLVQTGDEVIYLGDKRQVGGENCHQLVIRLDEVDVQLWISEGDRPLPRRIVITDKWEGGNPRLDAEMAWDTGADVSSAEFEFELPKDAARIDFLGTVSE